MLRRDFLASGLMTAAMLAAPAALAAAPTDAEIRDQVTTRLGTDPVVKGGALTVAVTDGVVTISGQLADERQRARAVKIAKRVKGVKEVIDKITLPSL